MKVKMKNGLILSIFVAFQNRWKCSYFCDLECASYAIRHHMASYSTSIAIINYNYKCTCN
jgi:hypothetical protein